MPKSGGRQSSTAGQELQHTAQEVDRISREVQQRVYDLGYKHNQTEYTVDELEDFARRQALPSSENLPSEISPTMTYWGRQATSRVEPMYAAAGDLYNEVLRPGSTRATVKPFEDKFFETYRDLLHAEKMYRAAGRQYNKARERMGLTG